MGAIGTAPRLPFLHSRPYWRGSETTGTATFVCMSTGAILGPVSLCRTNWQCLRSSALTPWINSASLGPKEEANLLAEPDVASSPRRPEFV